MTHHPCTPTELAASIAACGYAEFVTLAHLDWLYARYGRLSVADGDWAEALKAEPVQMGLFGEMTR